MVGIEKEYVLIMSKEVEKFSSVEKKFDELDKSFGEKVKWFVLKKVC